MGHIGVPELLLILLVVLIFFGAKKVPELARGLGSGIREFKKAAKEIGDAGDGAKAASSASDPAAPAKTVSTPPPTDGVPPSDAERS
jgi:sec-independent protein translocase protein TatA